MGKQKIITWHTDDITNCWICTSHAPNGRGYPEAVLDGKKDRIARHYYRKYNGVIPTGMHIRHTCDNRLCINPGHLLVGTNVDNVRDRIERNRCSGGRTNVKLTEDAVNDIRSDTVSTLRKLADKYGVTISAIAHVRKRRSWAA